MAHELYLKMYENAAKIRREGNDITPKSFGILYLIFETSNSKSVFTFCDNFKLVSFEIFGKYLYLEFQPTLIFYTHLYVYKLFVFIISNT